MRAIGSTASSAIALNAPCSEVWYYGGEISALGGSSSGTSLTSTTAVVSSSKDSFSGDVRVFGSAIRSGSLGLAGGHPAFNLATGASVSGGGQFHMHGGIINASASNFASADATGIDVAGPGSFAHTPDTAFVIKAGASGTGTRVAESGGGQVQSPFLWQSGTAPPIANLSSVEGADMYVEFDCGADGDCNAGGSQAHIMIYNPTECPIEIWFDSTTGRCRNVIAP